MDRREYLRPAHSPAHLFVSHSHYLVTARTYHRHHIFDSIDKRRHLCSTVLRQSENFGWELRAWCILSNHYHLVAEAPGEANTLSELIRRIHAISGRYANRIDSKFGRKVWHSYWDTCIRGESSLIARLHYVHSNAAKHGLVSDPCEYEFCSYQWFIDGSAESIVKEVLASRTNHVKLPDEF